MPDPKTIDFATLPKAELHLHIEGTLTPTRMLALAERNRVTLRYGSEAEVLAAYEFDSLQSFLDLYYEGMSVLQRPEDYYDLAQDYFAVCAAEGIRHAELGFDPQGHTSRGVAVDVVLDGLTAAQADAERAHGITSCLIMNILRHLPPDDALQTLDTIAPHADKIAAIGLDSSEVGFPPEPFEAVFAQARSRFGWRAVAHAGEEGPPAYISGALDALQVDRIDHGIRAAEDAALISRLVQSQVPLTVCPLSNVRLCAVEDMTKHNILDLLRAGLCVTVNSDDPSYFGGYLNANFAALATDLDPSTAELATLARNSFTASFTDAGTIAAGVAGVDAWLASHS
ncbi:MAG: adenosine deaminase [Pseudomonadota bacterium]